MSTSSDDDMTQRLADEFSRIIRDWLKQAQMAEVLRRNEISEPGICATHDFCDANVAMEEAFAIVLLRESDPSSLSDMALWSNAWVLARTTEFPRKMHLVKNADGVFAYAFTIRGFSIDNPHVSESGLAIDPIEQYGLRPAEIAALDNANKRLRADREATIARLHALFPNIEVRHTGGGCLALTCDDGGYLLITARDDSPESAGGARKVDARRYAANGDVLEEAAAIAIEALQRWVVAALVHARDPENIADYFSTKLGAAHGDDSLRTLPIESPCGQNCVEAIDAAAAVIGHIRVGFGEDRPQLVSSVMQIARQVIEVYWHG